MNGHLYLQVKHQKTWPINMIITFMEQRSIKQARFYRYGTSYHHFEQAGFTRLLIP